MNKTDLIAGIASATGLKKTEVAEVLEQLHHEVDAALYRGEDVVIPGICKVSVAERAARTGRNPRTGESVDIPARRVPHFKAAGELKGFVERL